MDYQTFLIKTREYEDYLRSEERSQNTCEKYARDLRAFALHLHDRTLSKAVVLEWKEALIQKYAPTSVNSMLAAVNGFFDWLELPQLKVKPLKIQRILFAKPERELTQAEYNRLVRAAEQKKNTRLSLLLQTICATGIRVSELRYITVESARTGRATADCKGKNRTVFLPKELCRLLCGYCKEKGIRSGVIFCTSGGKPIDRKNIWRDMKTLCKSAGVQPGKVFPHNLRHLFARTYYSLEKDLSRLADLLGHSSVSTTRIYTMESGTKHIKQIERMRLVLSKK